jgi:hypothetical protein
MDQLSLPHIIASAFLVIIGLLSVFLAPNRAITVIVAITSMTGYLRRLFMSYFAFTPLDPLVLIGFVIMLGYFISAVSRQQFASDNRLGKAVVALGIVLFLQMFNPLQGSPVVGIYGGLIFFGLFGAYQLGRSTSDNNTIERLAKMLIGVALLAGVYGMYQTFFGFSSIEKEWIYRQKLEAALGGIRVFSFFCSFSEYVQVLAVGSVICFAKMLKGNRSLIPIWLFLLACIVASSSRSSILSASFVHLVLWAIQGKDRRSWWPRLALALVLLPFLLTSGLSIAKDSSKDTALEKLVAHQEEGISDPLNDKKSTGSVHLELISNGFLSPLTHPLGTGTGSLTVAAGKFKSSSDAVAVGSEGDISDMFIMTGVMGGPLYVFIIGLTLWRVLEHWRRERQESILITLAVLLVLIGWWTANAHYMLPLVAWFFVGSVERREKLWLQMQLNDRLLKRKRAASAEISVIPSMPSSPAISPVAPR